MNINKPEYKACKIADITLTKSSKRFGYNRDRYTLTHAI